MQGAMTRQRVTFLGPVGADDGEGGKTAAWTNVIACDVPTQLSLDGSEERELAGRMVASNRWKWMTRFTSAVASITPKMRMRWTRSWRGGSATVTMEILSVQNVDGRNQQLVGTAIEVTA